MVRLDLIRQGDVYWLDLGRALTSNLKRAEAPGNVLLCSGEGVLPKQSVVNVSQIFTVDKSQLRERIGKLSSLRVRAVLDGIALLLEPRDL